MFKRLATILLLCPPRLLDVSSILVISTGINILSSATSAQSPAQTLLAGFVLLLSGILITPWRYAAESVWDIARLRSEEEKARFSAELRAQIPDPAAPRSFRVLRSLAAQETAAKRSLSLILTASIALFLFCGGVLASFRPVFVSTKQAANPAWSDLDRQRLQAIEKQLGEVKADIGRISLGLAPNAGKAKKPVAGLAAKDPIDH